MVETYNQRRARTVSYALNVTTRAAMTVFYTKCCDVSDRVPGRVTVRRNAIAFVVAYAYCFCFCFKFIKSVSAASDTENKKRRNASDLRFRQ